MSAKATIWAWAQPVPNSTARLVLLGLADIARDSGKIWAAQKYIADKIQMSERTVRDSLKALSDLGLVEVEDRPGKNAIIWLKLTPVILYPDGPEPDETPAGDSATPANGSMTPAARSDEPKIEPVKKPKNAQARDSLFEDLPNGSSDRSKKGRGGERQSFMLAWDAFPIVGKKRSSPKLSEPQYFAALKRSGGDPEVILNSIKRYSRAVADSNDANFVPGFHRWLRDDRWSSFLDDDSPPYDEAFV